MTTNKKDKEENEQLSLKDQIKIIGIGILTVIGLVYCTTLLFSLPKDIDEIFVTEQELKDKLISNSMEHRARERESKVFIVDLITSCQNEKTGKIELEIVDNYTDIKCNLKK